MISQELFIVLAIGIILMCVLIAVQMKWYGIPAWKSVVVSVALALTGLYGSRFWFYVENGYYEGRSFYGAIFLSPIVFLVVAKLFKMPYKYTLDFVAPGGCLTLALVKIQCLMDGCCDGMVLYIDENRNYVKFPSQIVEMTVFLIISAALLYMSKKNEFRGKIFPWFMVMYGASRFVLDFFRGGTEPYALGLSAGSFWSLCSFVIGTVILVIMKHSKEIKHQ